MLLILAGVIAFVLFPRPESALLEDQSLIRTSAASRNHADADLATGGNPPDQSGPSLAATATPTEPIAQIPVPTPDLPPTTAPAPAPAQTSQSADGYLSCPQFYSELIDAEGDALVTLLGRVDQDCILDLEWLSDQPLVQIAASRESNVISVANAITGQINDQDQNTSLRDARNLFEYLVQAKDIHNWCLAARSCGRAEFDGADSYPTGRGSPVYSAVKAAVDSFVEIPGADADIGDRVSRLDAVFYVVANYGLTGEYLPIVSDWLRSWDDAAAARDSSQRRMHIMLDFVYDSHRLEGFGAYFGEDQGLLQAFADFTLNPRWLGTKSQWDMERMVLEIGRYTKYKDTSNYERVVPIIRSLLEVYEGSPEIYLPLVAEIFYNDWENCDRYGLCEWHGGDGFNANFRDRVFPHRLKCPEAACGDQVVLHAQGLDGDQLDLACRRLFAAGQRFHEMCGTDCRPVSGDVNDRLEIYVFEDGKSCEYLESGAFGAGADSCSGIYWEGDPQDPDNQATIVVTEYTLDEFPPDPELSIWNFEHEYAHYLDGRYNLYGGYSDDPAIHWWTEGFAEYFAAETSDFIHPPAYESPHTLTNTLLFSGSIPTEYDDRHLAFRYLIENRIEFVGELLQVLRLGEIEEFKSIVRRDAPHWESEWFVWQRSRR